MKCKFISYFAFIDTFYRKSTLFIYMQQYYLIIFCSSHITCNKRAMWITENPKSDNKSDKHRLNFTLDELYQSEISLLKI